MLIYNKIVKMLTKEFFFDLERRLIDAGLDSDLDSFEVIKARFVGAHSCALKKEKISADEFARQVIYVILASGFSQKTAKKKHAEIMDYLVVSRQSSVYDLLKLFNNKNKINAIVRVWQNRAEYRDNYYAIETQNTGVIPAKAGINCCAALDPVMRRGDAELLNKKLLYLQKLPHIGKITANHLARNLGENVFKRDVWIERLLFKYGENCLEKLAVETSLPIGYVDVVVWKGLQNGFIKL
jgi:hypothetical protein